MASSSTTIWKIALAVLVAYLLLNRRGPRRNVATSPRAPVAPAPAPPTARPPPPSAASTPIPVPAHGLRITETGELEIANWHEWMRFATRTARRAVAEGAYLPDQVIARIFYAAFPDQNWPPDADSPLVETYDLLVEVAQANLDAQLRPLRVRTGHGLKLVD